MTTAAWCRCPDSPAASSPPIATAAATPAGPCRGAPTRSSRRSTSRRCCARSTSFLPLGPKTATTDEEIRGRLEMLLGVDDSLGRILATLERKGVLDDTVVVFTSDHGYFYGEHGLNEERRLAYEETIRIPLVVRYPRLAMAGSTPPEMALSIDLAPTLLEVAGLQPGADIQGRSLVPVLKQEARDWRSSFLIEYFSDTVFPRIRNMGYVAVRTSRHKYIQYRELQGMDELYDLETDPYEEMNIIDRSDAREALQKMQAELRRLIEQTRYVAPTPAINPASRD